MEEISIDNIMDFIHNAEDVFLTNGLTVSPSVYKEIQNVVNENKQYKKQLATLRKLCRERIESCNAAIGNPDYTIISKTQLLLNEVINNKRLLQILVNGSDE